MYLSLMIIRPGMCNQLAQSIPSTSTVVSPAAIKILSLSAVLNTLILHFFLPDVLLISFLHKGPQLHYLLLGEALPSW
jgi:hypothetical protein